MRGSEARTVVLYDQQPLWLDALEQLLSKVGIEVVGKTTEADEAVALVEEFRPDVLITEVRSSSTSAPELESIRRARSTCPEVKAVVLSASDDPAQIDAAFDAGAGVVCVKTAEPDDLLTAIRQAFQHSIYVAGARERLAMEFPVVEPVDVPELTRRELEILRLVAEGYSNSQLAKMLWVTEQTVKFHLSNIYRKLDVSNRTEASRWAQVHGVLGTVASAQAAGATA
jgi:DNA-binding NarL/FixJ family response regulator